MVLIGIALPALLLTLVVRRWYGPLPWTVATGAFVLSIAFLHGAVFTNRLPVPVDEVMRGYPFHGMFDVRESRNPLTNDTVKQILPWMQVAREELLHGRLPLWNRHQFAGYPLLANGQSAPFAPLFLLTLPIPLPDQLVAMAGLKLFLSLIFAWLFLRAEGVSGAAAGFGAIAFTFSVFQTVYLYYPLGTVSSMLPAAAFACIGCARHREARWFVLLAVVTATVLASGHPETAVHIGIACALLLALEWRSPIRPLLAALTGAALAAPAWLPVLEQVFVSVRAATLAGAPHGSLHAYVAWLLLNPDAFGNPSRGTWQWISNYSVVAPTYLGLVPLALLAGTRGRREWTMLGCCVVLFLLAMNWSAPVRALNAVPPLSLIAPDRLRVVVLLFVVLLGARVLDRKPRISTLLGGASIAVAAAWLLRAKWTVTLDWYATAGVIGLGLFLLAVAIRHRSATIVAACAVLAELFVFNAGFNVLVPRTYYRPDLPILETVRRLSAGEPSRVIGHDWTLLPNAAAQYGLEDLRGSDPMGLARYDRLLETLAAPDPTSDVRRIQNVDHPQLGALNVRFLMTDPAFTPSPIWQLRYEGPDGKLFERTDWTRRFYAPEPGVTVHRIVQKSATLLEVDVESARDGGVVHSSQSAASGWRVRGAKQFVVDDLFVGFSVPRGRTVVRVTYLPGTFLAGGLLMLLALVILAVVARRRVPAQDVVASSIPA